MFDTAFGDDKLSILYNYYLSNMTYEFSILHAFI